MSKTKLGYYVTGEDASRVRAAFLAGRDRHGWRTFSDFQLVTMLERVEELERELNGGERFKSAGALPPGRAVGE